MLPMRLSTAAAESSQVTGSGMWFSILACFNCVTDVFNTTMLKYDDQVDIRN